MKYVLLLVRSDEEWEALSDEQRDYEAIMRWFAGVASSGVLQGGAELQPSRTARTVHWEGGRPVQTDGPFVEAKETVGGFAVVEAADLDAALAIAQTWPAQGHKVEVRPIVQH